MLDLWAAGEKDMLEEDNQYRLSNTGQGLQRVQASLVVVGIAAALFVKLLLLFVTFRRRHRCGHRRCYFGVDQNVKSCFLQLFASFWFSAS